MSQRRLNDWERAYGSEHDHQVVPASSTGDLDSGIESEKHSNPGDYLH